MRDPLAECKRRHPASQQADVLAPYLPRAACLIALGETVQMGTSVDDDHNVPNIATGGKTVEGYSLGKDIQEIKDCLRNFEAQLTQIAGQRPEGQKFGRQTGWWIKVCRKKTEATWFKVKAGPDKNNIVFTKTWNQGDPEEFPIDGVSAFGKIYVVGYSGQNDKNTYFGVCYDTQVCCKHYDFDHDEGHGGEDHDVESGNSDEWKCT